MKKVINVEPGEVFAKLTTGKEIYAIDTASDQLFNLHYESVCSVLTKLKSEGYAYFIVEEAET